MISYLFRPKSDQQAAASANVASYAARLIGKEFDPNLVRELIACLQLHLASAAHTPAHQYTTECLQQLVDNLTKNS